VKLLVKSKALLNKEMKGTDKFCLACAMVNGERM